MACLYTHMYVYYIVPVPGVCNQHTNRVFSMLHVLSVGVLQINHFGMKLKRGINIIIFACQQINMSIEFMGEDSIFIMKAEHIY